MPFHLLAYTKADTAATSNEDITAVTDNFATVQNGHYILQQDCYLMAAYARDAGATNARVNTPHYRFVSIPSIEPINRGAAVPSIPPYAWYPPGNLKVPRIDEVAFELSNDGAGGVRAIGGLWICDAPNARNIPQGDVYTLRGTSVITTAAFAWTLGGLTLDQTLPAGNYTVIGLRTIGVTTEFVRFAPLGGGMRPGVINDVLIANFDPTLRFRNGNLGSWFTFANTALPNIEVFATAAAAITYTLYIDVVKVS